eukprot:TRINITY_DN12232_c0_g1_i1.p1 TRINITY_DN12232_c0_g1~~TRINITY_DN12232_c0_g1_i1.p1  ORF type:complete len:347 (-),score=62.20 TRINITY_DN12232_c0_g1_i1:41-1081(-)
MLMIHSEAVVSTQSTGTDQVLMDSLYYILFAFLGLLFFHWLCRFFSRTFRLPNLQQKSVLITGCDSGFGKELALKLSGKGITVFAGCLTEKGKDELANVNHLHAFLMDVTSPKSVKDGFAFVSKKLGERGLWGIVNNAGVLRGTNLECSSLKDWQLQLNVNVVGIFLVTQAFLPLLRKEKGSRIVNISSVAGRFAFPGTSSYSASKFAVQGLSDSLRRELAMWGMKVIIIEPGVMRTPLWDVPFDRARMEADLKDLPKEVFDLYGMDYFEQGHQAGKKLVANLSNDPKLVVNILEESLTTRYPLTRYSVGSDTYMWFFLAYSPTWLSDWLLSLDKNKPIPQALKKK